MRCIILDEHGEEIATKAITLSYNAPTSKAPELAKRLAHKDGGHNKFLESIYVWLSVQAPRYWWQQFDAYRVGVSKQSESTMHTLLKNKIDQSMFEGKIDKDTVKHLEKLRQERELTQLKRHLPEAFLQTRIVSLNYKALRNIYKQRCNHKLREWHIFFDMLLNGLRHPEWVSF
jgi:hypothetical protein